ncbi:MAG: hypothetical protein ACJA01_000756 [Saprospiraceae bacterium]|jgi:uncharacterized protein (DUF2147 family)
MIIKVTQLLLVSIITMISLSAQTNLVGKWNTGEDSTIVQTYKRDGAWYREIMSSDNPKAKIGTNILRGFKKEGDKWIGKLYAAKRDKIMKSEIRLIDSALNITVFAGFITRNLTWEKIENNDD